MPRRVAFLLLSILVPLPLLGATLRFANKLPAAPQSTALVLLSEVAWAGTAASSSDEWIELFNPSSGYIDLTGWSLSDGSDLNVQLGGELAPGAFFLLERTDDTTVADIIADQIYAGSLGNSGEALFLLNAAGVIVDGLDANGGWPGGSGAPEFLTMERSGSATGAGWSTNDGQVQNGIDAAGAPIAGTPKQPNSSWATVSGPDLSAIKDGPVAEQPGGTIEYRVEVSNVGTFTATDVLITDMLPASLQYVTDDSGLLLSQPSAGTLVWQLPALPPGFSQQFGVTATVLPIAGSLVTNTVSVWSPQTDGNDSNNHAHHVTAVGSASTGAVLLDAVLYDGTVSGDLDEAISLVNLNDSPVDIGGWSVSDRFTLSSGVALPPGSVLASGQRLWLARDGLAFSFAFGHLPDYQADATAPGVPLLLGGWPGYSNTGDEVVLRDSAGLLQDVLVYEAGSAEGQGWIGPSLLPYAVGSNSGSNGQVLYRKRDQETGLPVTDTNGAADWAQDYQDVIDGRKVRYAGWDLDAFFFTTLLTETARLTVAVAPDNAYEALRAHIVSAQQTIQIETLTFENMGLADALVAAAARGVEVTVLLEGGPTGGITDQEKAVCQRLEQAGAACWFMVTDGSAGIVDRYGYLHAKFLLVDGVRVAIGSENLSRSSLPADDKSDGTAGRRGIYLLTNAAGVVAHVAAVFAADFEPRGGEAPYGHTDLRRWSATDPVYGPPSPGYVPFDTSGGISYTVRYSEPVAFSGTFPFELIQSPENSLRNRDGLLGLIGRVAVNDTLLVQQLDEPPHWAGAGENPLTHPNVRLEAMIHAARRGATVRILLDAALDDPTSSTSNRQTCLYVKSIALQENLDLYCATANPTGMGIHNKMVLAHVDGAGYIHLGSLNGTEQSSKANRELAVQFQSNEVYRFLAEMFQRDWPYRVFLPGFARQFHGAASHPLITEVMVDPTGPDDAEYIEIANPTSRVVDLSQFGLGDAVLAVDFEDLRRFPLGTLLAPGSSLVVAFDATAFRAVYGRNPDFEIVDSDPTVANLIDDPAWGHEEALLQLGNAGDEVLLRDATDAVVDLMVYGTGSFDDAASCPLVAYGHALARVPWWRDTDECPQDFAAQFPPTPGW